MGAEKIYNGSVDVVQAVEDGEGDGNTESYQLSTLSVDLSLPLPAMTPRIMFVSLPFSFAFFFLNTDCLYCLFLLLSVLFFFPINWKLDDQSASCFFEFDDFISLLLGGRGMRLQS